MTDVHYSHMWLAVPSVNRFFSKIVLVYQSYLVEDLMKASHQEDSVTLFSSIVVTCFN